MSNYENDLQYISEILLPEWLEKFELANHDYGNAPGAVLGVKGEFAEISRKTLKLKRALWDGVELIGEQPREILTDLIGHCYLAITRLDNPTDQFDDSAYELK